MNINISDIRDEADYIVNLGKEAEAKAKNEALANIEEQQKLGAIKIAEQQKERATKVAETNRDKNTQLADTQRDEEIKVAIADKERESKVAEEKRRKRITYRQSQRLYGSEQGTGAYRTGESYCRAPVRYGDKAGGSTKEIGHRAK